MEEQPFEDAILEDHSLTMMDIIFEKVIKDILNEQGTKSIVERTLDDGNLPNKLFSQFDDFQGITEAPIPKVKAQTRDRNEPNRSNVLIQKEENHFINSFFDGFFLEMISEAANGKRNLNINDEEGIGHMIPKSGGQEPRTDFHLGRKQTQSLQMVSSPDSKNAMKLHTNMSANSRKNQQQGVTALNKTQSDSYE